ncbi:MAG: hypothetical protein JNK64_14115, partial [Myxococcales bacterium]|nr:hypothetical protein [Myxococcales bacterium]
MRRTALAALVVLAAPATARADEPAPWLFPRRVPMPTSLAMRFEPSPTAPAAPAPAAAPAAPAAAATPTSPPPPRPR